MTVRDYLKVLRKRWTTVLVITGLAVLVAGIASYTATRLYTSTSSVFFSLPSGTSGMDLLQGSNFAQSQMLSYADIATKPIVLDAVVKELDLDTTSKQLAGSVSATASRDTVVIDLAVVSASPQMAADISNSTAKHLIGTVRELSPKAANGSPTIEAKVVAVAQPPVYASSPNTRRNLLAALAGGLFIGTLVAWVREMLDTSVRTTETLASVSGAPVLGSVPFDKAAERSPLMTGLKVGARRAEAYRQLRTALQFTHVDRPPQVIVVTSATAAEGKSMTAANLALVVAETEQQVLLVEADLRRPRVSEYLGVDRSVGLSDVLAGLVDVSEVVQSVGPYVDVLPSGSTAPNPSELLGSRSMIDLVEQLRSQYAMVVFDTPPLLPVTDAAVVSALSDGVVLVARYGHSKRGRVAAAVGSLRAVDAQVLGAVLNGCPSNADSTGGYGYYSHEPQGKTGRLRRLLDRSRSSTQVADPDRDDEGDLEPSGPAPGRHAPNAPRDR